jgi:thiol-disulfide isomerase/thioredoxin
MTLLHFWNSSCAPCITEAPTLLQLSRRYRDVLTTINVSNDPDRQSWRKGIRNAGIGKMINVLDSNSVTCKKYSINVIPAYYLIDERQNLLLKGSLEEVAAALEQKFK